MRVQFTAAIIVVFCVLAIQTTVWGQLIGSNTSSGTFGGRSLSGGSGNSGIGAGSRSSGGGSGVAARSVGSGNVGLEARDQFLRTREAREFVGGGSADREGFVGASQSDSTTGNRASQGLGPGNSGGGRSANQGRGSGNTSRRGRGDIRTTISVAFDFPKRPPATLGTDVAARIARIGAIKALSSVGIVVDRGTATLRGVVATDHDRQLIDRLVRLEPGVWKVKNELVVAQSPAAAERFPLEEVPAAAPAVDSPAGTQ